MLYLKLMVVCLMLLLLNEFRLVKYYAHAIQNKQFVNNSFIKLFNRFYQAINQSISDNNKLFN